MHIAVVLHPRPRENVGRCAIAGKRIVFDAQARRRAHAVVDHLIAVLAGAIEHHRPATADAAHPRFQHAKRKGGRNHRIDAIAARRQYFGADFGRLRDCAATMPPLAVMAGLRIC